MRMSSDSRYPYTDNPNRLSDVIAAIQFMGAYGFYKLKIEEWAKRIRTDNQGREHWKKIFLDHREFFRIDSTNEKASLVRRRAQPKNYNVDSLRTVSKAEYGQLSEEEKDRISRAPLEGSDIEALINTAIELHSQEISHKREKRLVYTVLLNGLPALLGVVIGMLGAYHLDSLKAESAFTKRSLAEFAKEVRTETDEERKMYDRLKNQLAVCAPSDVVEPLADYHSECRDKEGDDLTNDCKRKWAEVVNAMRKASGKENVPIETLTELIYFEGSGQENREQ